MWERVLKLDPAQNPLDDKVGRQAREYFEDPLSVLGGYCELDSDDGMSIVVILVFPDSYALPSAATNAIPR